MLEWIWFGVLLVVMVGVIAWDSYHDFTDGEASMLRMIVSFLCFLLCLSLKSDLLVEQPYHWLLNVLPEPNTDIQFFTALFLTGCLLVVYLSCIVVGTYFAVNGLARKKVFKSEVVK